MPEFDDRHFGSGDWKYIMHAFVTLQLLGYFFYILHQIQILERQTQINNTITDFLLSKYGLIFTEFDSIDWGEVEVNTFKFSNYQTIFTE